MIILIPMMMDLIFWRVRINLMNKPRVFIEILTYYLHKLLTSLSTSGEDGKELLSKGP
jgi:hypothetical protein